MDTVSYLEFNVPFQHKYGYIRDKPGTQTHLGGARGRAFDMRSTTSRGFNSYLGQNLCNNLGQVVHIYVPFVTKQYNLVPANGW